MPGRRDRERKIHHTSRNSGDFFQRGSYTDLLAVDEKKRRQLLGSRIALVFQNPESYFDSLMTVGDQFVEFLQYRNPAMKKETCLEVSAQALQEMRLDDPERLLKLYPFELSGGMLQRSSIAMAMLTKPKLLLWILLHRQKSWAN